MEVAPGLAAAHLYMTVDSPPPPRPSGSGELVDLGVGPGLATWNLWHWSPGGEYQMHHTDTVDFDTVLDGSVVLILDDGEHPLEAGDHLVVTGVDHGWRAGAEGCTLVAIALGATKAD